MTVALMAIGAMLGFALNSGHGTETLLTMLLGGVAGYALGELHSLGVRSRELEKDVSGLKERLAAMQREQRETEASKAASSEAREPRSVPELAPEGLKPGAAAMPSSHGTIPAVGSVPAASPVPPVEPKSAPSVTSGWSRATIASSDPQDVGTTHMFEPRDIPHVSREPKIGRAHV